MKRKVILVTLLNLTLFLGISMNAQTDIHTDIPIDIQTNVLTGISTDVPTDIQVGTQTDAFFTYELSQRSEDMSGLAFMDFYGQGFNNYKGLNFQGFTGNSNNDVCVGNGVLMMAATGFFYLINKKRKENK